MKALQRLCMKLSLMCGGTEWAAGANDLPGVGYDEVREASSASGHYSVVKARATMLDDWASSTEH